MGLAINKALNQYITLSSLLLHLSTVRKHIHTDNVFVQTITWGPRSFSQIQRNTQLRLTLIS